MKKYRIEKNSILYIENNALKKMIKYCQKQGMNESGGVLLGKVKRNYSEFIITDISEPCNQDKSGRYYFVRNKKNAQMIINESWKQSNGEINYIGEWHTHPEVSPTPSFIDKRLLNQCLKKNKYYFNGLFLIIVGIKGQLYVGYKTEKMKKQKQLKIIKEQ